MAGGKTPIAKSPKGKKPPDRAKIKFDRNKMFKKRHAGDGLRDVVSDTLHPNSNPLGKKASQQDKAQRTKKRSGAVEIAEPRAKKAKKARNSQRDDVRSSPTMPEEAIPRPDQEPSNAEDELASESPNTELARLRETTSKQMAMLEEKDQQLQEKVEELQVFQESNELHETEYRKLQQSKYELGGSYTELDRRYTEILRTVAQGRDTSEPPQARTNTKNPSSSDDDSSSSNGSSDSSSSSDSDVNSDSEAQTENCAESPYSTDLVGWP
jgi:hypothetical protein